MRKCIHHPTCHVVPTLQKLGVGVPKGCDQRCQATPKQYYGYTHHTGSIMVKLNISDAFNSLHRHSMLASVDEILPDLAANCHLAYAEARFLQFGKFTVQSQEGSQQGDHLGTVTLLPGDSKPPTVATGFRIPRCYHYWRRIRGG